MLEFTETIFGFTLSTAQDSFLDVCKSGADKTDCKKWQLTAQQWRRCISVALYHAGVDMAFDTVNNDTCETNTGAHRQAMTQNEACYIFGLTVTDNEINFMGELCKSHGYTSHDRPPSIELNRYE